MKRDAESLSPVITAKERSFLEGVLKRGTAERATLAGKYPDLDEAVKLGNEIRTRRPGDQPPMLDLDNGQETPVSAEDQNNPDAALEARLAALTGGAPRDPRLAAEIAAYEQANPDAALEARLAALKGEEGPDPELLAMISAHEEAEGLEPESGPSDLGGARADAALEARLAALTGGAPRDPELLAQIAAYEQANPDAALEARLAALTGGAPKDPRLAAEIAAFEQANPDAALEARLAALTGGAPKDPRLAAEIAAYEQANPDAALEARLAALKGEEGPDPELLAMISAHEEAEGPKPESGPPDLGGDAYRRELREARTDAALEALLAAQTGRAPKNDAERAVSRARFSAGVDLVESSLSSLVSTHQMALNALGVSHDVTPGAAVLLMTTVEQIGGNVRGVKAMLDQGSNLMSGTGPGDPTRADLADLLALGKRNIKEVRLLLPQIEQVVDMLRPVAAVHVAHQHAAFASPQRVGRPFPEVGLLLGLQTSLARLINLVAVGVAMERAASRVAEPAARQVEGLQFSAAPVREQAAEQQPDLQFPAVPVREQAAEQQPDLQFPDIPAAVGKDVEKESLLVQPSGARQRGD